MQSARLNMADLFLLCSKRFSLENFPLVRISTFMSLEGLQKSSIVGIFLGNFLHCFLNEYSLAALTNMLSSSLGASHLLWHFIAVHAVMALFKSRFFYVLSKSTDFDKT